MNLTNGVTQLRQTESPYEPKAFMVGLDYGTTFSAGAFALSSAETIYLSPGDVHPITGYTGAFNSSKSKSTEIPSDICYIENTIKIGYEASANQNADGNHLQWVKLDLDHRDEMEPARATLKTALDNLPFPKQAEEIIEDYLTELFGIFKQRMELNGYHAEDSIEFNCTVPSMWSLFARRKMVNAVEAAACRAQFGTDSVVNIWPEAEAATEYVLSKFPKWKLERGENFIVCDAGGGTVDYTTYAADESEPLRLRELAEASGLLCGSTSIDDRYLSLIESRVAAIPSIKANKSEASIRNSMNSLRYAFSCIVKPTYAGSLGLLHDSPFPGMPVDPSRGNSEDYLQIEGKDVLPIFQHVSEQLWCGLRAQLRKAWELKQAVKYIILVGGFSGSDFLRKYLKERLRSETEAFGFQQPIELLVPDTVDSSVAQGAIRCSLKQRGGVGTHRINRSSVGIIHSQRYDPKLAEHRRAKDSNQVHQDEVDKKYYVYGLIRWVLKKGERQPTQSRTMKLYRTIPENSTGAIRLHVTFYASDQTCKEGYTDDYYRKHCGLYTWEKVSFDIDMATIKSSELQPIPHKRRRRKQQAPAVRSAEPRRSRRIKHLHGQNVDVGKPAGPKCHLTPSNETGKLQLASERDSSQKVSTDDDEFLETSPGAPVATEDSVIFLNEKFSQLRPLTETTEEVTAELDEKPECFYHIEYTVVITFSGLHVNYQLDCPAAGFTKAGKVELPDRYEFGTA